MLGTKLGEILMGWGKSTPLPLGLPEQVDGLATAPSDRGDETQERFRYQWAIGVWLLAQSLAGKRAIRAMWCEHHEDFLLELPAGRYIAVQVKTDSRENARWRWSDDALVDSVARFCAFEKTHGSAIDSYEFISNAAPYVPAATTTREDSLAASPDRLIQCCSRASTHSELEEPYQEVFTRLVGKTGGDAIVLFEVLRKLTFAQGPVLRGYDDTLAASIVPKLPGCAGLTTVSCCRLRDELIGLVQAACRLRFDGIDGAVAYLATNGRPHAAIRGKCITPEAAAELMARVRQPTFRFVGSGVGIDIGATVGRTEVLNRKMRNAYLGSQFEPLRMRMDSADQRLMERALLEPDDFDAIANQLVSTVLVECKDVEAMAFDHADDKTRGLAIYKQILQRMDSLAKEEPERVCREPKDTLMGIAGMLSGECKFAWGTPLDEETRDGA
ncbi:dsDNA nuclease domain-containing protein [Cupriavidus alkaliphilus]|uniref:dsDNA nuclease domain-containing protein n=1 Tax=Cupriavidus alkaliphilus TaxID=942866 RepID=UPI000DD73D7D|nr:dsDNA nuclease domain-containing protein [Cupriavidus alkaliphilus]